MTEPLLLRVARLCVGLAEVPGPASNPVIMRWAADLRAPAYGDDSVAWCAVAMNRWMLACNYPLSGTGYDLLRAKSFSTWGQPCEPVQGAVLVFSRPAGYHVGLYLGERTDAFSVLGGNTGNAVGATWIARDRLRASRWPSGVSLQLIQRVFLRDDGQPVSGDEA